MSASLATFGQSTVTTNVLTGSNTVIMTGSGGVSGLKVIDSIYVSERSGAGTATTFNIQVNASSTYSFVKYNQLFTNSVSYTDTVVVLPAAARLEIKSTANVDVVVNYRQFKTNLIDA